MDDFLSMIRRGPDTVEAAGEYAMWHPSPAEPTFGASLARENLNQLYEASAGIETYMLGGIARRLGLAGAEPGRVALPDELRTFPVVGPAEEVFVLTVSKEKGIRLHFHRSTPSEYRNDVLAALVTLAHSTRRAVALEGLPPDEVGEEESPGRWWAMCDRVIAEMEAKGDPPQAVGVLL